MNKSVFNPQWQQEDLPSKVVAGLERISGALKVLLWEKAKLVGLSTTQIQILIFIAFHDAELCNVSHLAKEFNITKPTVSDAVRVLDNKKMIEKEFSASDSRSYTIRLSPLGEKIVSETSDFADPVKEPIYGLGEKDLESLYDTVSHLIHKLNRNGILAVQRTCYGCKFYQRTGKTSYCGLLKKKLSNREVRLDCSVYQKKLSDRAAENNGQK